jgi:mRNA interferase RelE/StbE
VLVADGTRASTIRTRAMNYEILYQPSARATLDHMSPDVARRILRKIDRLRNDLAGDVKRLKAFVPEYRLRVGDWRVLFDVSGPVIVVHDIKHRSQAYD